MSRSSFMEQTELLKNKLEQLIEKKINLTIKDNRSVFLSIRKNSYKEIKIILHKAFLDAPPDILFSLKEYIIDDKKVALRKIKNFMELFYESRDYSSNLDETKLDSLGQFYNLSDILKELGRKYFFNDLNEIKITWFNKRYKKNFRSITFGSYDRGLKLIKINKLLDDDFFPQFFVSFVVFHEILHHMYPVLIDKNGRRKVHYKKFKEMEKSFEDYSKAQNFEKQFLKKRKAYGRT